MMKDKKLNREELKDFFRVNTIFKIVDNCFYYYGGNSIGLSCHDHLWRSSIDFGWNWKGAGWSKTTMKNRWDDFVLEGFIRDASSIRRPSGYVDSDEWRQEVIDKAMMFFIGKGFTKEPKSIDLFGSISSVKSQCVEFLLKEFNLC